MAGKIFISYRREDEQGYAVRLYEHMSESFGKEQLFFDVDSIPPGFDFVKYIEKQIALSDIVLVVIGRNWLNASDEHGRRRLDKPEDFVRVEIESALKQDKHVIPVLVQGAPMPLSTQLPSKLRPLARRNAFFATHVGFRAEAARLVAALETTLEAFDRSRLTEQERVLEEARRRDAERAETERQAQRERDRQEAEQAALVLRLENEAKVSAETEQRRLEEARRTQAALEAAGQAAKEAERRMIRQEVPGPILRPGEAERKEMISTPKPERINTPEPALESKKTTKRLWVRLVSIVVAVPALVYIYFLAINWYPNFNIIPGVGLSVVINWSRSADKVDLSIKCPSGEIIDRMHPNACGGNFVQNYYSGKSEAAVWKDQPLPGRYVVFASRRGEAADSSASFQVQLEQPGQVIHAFDSYVSASNVATKILWFTVPSQ